MALTPSVCSPLFVSNYSKRAAAIRTTLRDLGQLLNFNVKWDNGVVVETDKPYTGEQMKGRGT